MLLGPGDQSRAEAPAARGYAQDDNRLSEGYLPIFQGRVPARRPQEALELPAVRPGTVSMNAGDRWIQNVSEFREARLPAGRLLDLVLALVPICRST